MFINRDWKRSEEDDFRLNVLPRLDSGSEAVPEYSPAEYYPFIIGWGIQPRGE
jgi:hypothetical protein